MGNIFQARSGMNPFKDFATAAEAQAYVETQPYGHVVEFVTRPNLPGLLPPVVHNSIAMWTYEDGRWYGVAIFGSGGDRWQVSGVGRSE